MKPSPIERREVRRTTLVVALLVSLPGAIIALDVRGQAPPAWQAGLVEADAAYQETLRSLSETRRRAAQKAGQDWLSAMKTEIAEAVRGDDVTLAKGLKTQVDEAREAGRVSLERPVRRATFKDHEYALIDDAQTWEEARKRCESMGGHLLVLDNAAEERFVLESCGADDFWIGASDLWSPGRYLTLDGKPFRSFAFPFRGDTPEKRRNSVGWSAEGKRWDIFADGRRIPFVCEWE